MMNQLVILAILATFNIDMASSRRWSKDKWSPRGINSETCLSGDGSSYRGTVSESRRNRLCLNWNRFKLPSGASKGLGDHNYCRNPDESVMPWCRVRRGRKIVRELCSIPRCSTPTAKPSPPPLVDTELTCGERSEVRMHKIVGGSFKPIESNPWVAAIFHKRSSFLCGGSLIAPCWVLTAAHCFPNGNETNIQDLSVYLGKTAIKDTDADREQRFTVKEVIIHQQFNESSFNNDIALLKIGGRNGECAVRSASARTVCLAPGNTQLPAGFQCSIAGFGRESFSAWYNSEKLKQAEVNLIPTKVCTSKPYYADLITENMFCAGSPDWSTDACKGDSGGPLVCEAAGRMFLFGVVSWGDGCASRNKPGVYTQVTKYNKWIAENTGLPGYTKGSMYPMK